MAFGQTTLGTIGKSVEVSADGRPLAKIGGATIDWTTVAAISGSDVTWNDNVVVKVGEKGLRYGQVICRITSVVNGSTVDKYGPHDPAATDGRQTLARGSTFILNRTALANEPQDEYPEAIYGGQIDIDRVLHAGTGTASLAAGPQLAALLAVLPEAHPVTFK